MMKVLDTYPIWIAIMVANACNVLVGIVDHEAARVICGTLAIYIVALAPPKRAS